jgi:phosphoribosylanthranilate isomerase
LIIKICGIKTLEDALVCVQEGADALGFNFYKRSPRYIRPELVNEISAEIPTHIIRVGVFVDEPPPQMASIVREADLDVVQIHGGGKAPRGARLWRALNFGSDFEAADVEREANAEAFVLDSPAPGTFGGTGKTFDWTKIPKLKKKVVLAGGLSHLNVAEAIRIVQPWGVDACSKLEYEPGKKDFEKVSAFIRAARGIKEEEEESE